MICLKNWFFKTKLRLISEVKQIWLKSEMAYILNNKNSHCITELTKLRNVDIIVILFTTMEIIFGFEINAVYIHVFYFCYNL